MAGLDRVPPPPPTINGSHARRTAAGGFGGVTPIQAHGAGIPADLYGLHPEEILRQPGVTLGDGLIPRPDFGLKTPEDLAGLRADLINPAGAIAGSYLTLLGTQCCLEHGFLRSP